MVTSAINNNPYSTGATQGGISADVYARVEKVMSSQTKGVAKLNDALTRDQTKLSALGQLHSALAKFQAVAQGVSGAGLATSASSSTPGVLGASTTGKAASGTYAIDVKQLAQGQVLSGAPQKTADAAIGAGGPAVIKVEFGATVDGKFTPGDAKNVKSITLGAGKHSLQDIAAAFKEAGIDAQVIKGDDGYALVMKGQSGAANGMRISVSGDAGVKELVSYPAPAGAKGLGETAPAQDALLTVNGTQVKSALNKISTAIPGATLDLTAKGTTNVVVAQDSSQIASNVANLVSAYNTLNAKIQTLQKGDLKTDSALGQISGQLGQVLRSGGNGVPSSVLANAGVSINKNGDMVLDEKKLKAAIAADPDAVAKLFTNQGAGVADQFASKIGALTGDGGALKKEASTVGKEITTLTNKKAVLAKALTAQATALVNLYSQQGAGGGSGASRSLFDFMA